MVMLGELYNFLCKECREIVTEVAFPFGQKAEKIVCPECGSNKLELWNPKDGKCPKCGGKMKNTGDGYMIDQINMAESDQMKELLLSCKYYKGEPECPHEKNAGFWMYEKMWVEASLNEPKRIEEWETECKFEHLESMAEEYNIPKSMVGLLSNRYNHWNFMGTPEGFRKMIKEEYLKLEQQKGSLSQRTPYATLLIK